VKAQSWSRRDRLADAYYELESGNLDPAGVDASVWSALAEILKANVRDLASWRLPPLEATAAYRFSDMQAPLITKATIRPARESERDEVDRLFRSVG